MWKSDKWVIVGIIGSMISLALLLSLAFIFGEGEGNVIMPVIFTVMIFFTGYMFGGFRSGIKWVFITAGLMIFAVAAGTILGILEEKGLIPESFGKILIPILIGIFFYILSRLYNWIFMKHMNKIGPSKDDDYDEYDEMDEIEEYPIGEEFIFLIQPEWFKPDRVYKIIYKEGNFYFCRVGGQFYEIDEIEENYKKDSPENELLKDRFNYKMDGKSIMGILIRKKPSSWTGHLPNNGTLRMSITGDKTRKFIVHPINEVEEVKRFFEGRGIGVEER
jgi:hypothetical protein